MKHVLSLSCIALALVTLSACEKKADTPLPPSDTPVAPAPPAAAPTPEKAMIPSSVIDLEKIPVQEQFEAEVAAEVTPVNFEQQLDALEKEIKAP
jgi:predicted small lipoprotein YifL